MFVLMVSVAGGTLEAQTPWPDPGERIRVTGVCERDPGRTGPSRPLPCRVEGRFVRAHATTLTIAVGDSTADLGLEGVSRIEVSRGVRTHRLAGAVTGLAVGAAITAFALHRGGSTSKCDRSANQDALNSRECLGLTALGGLAGAGLGALGGGLLRSERWREIPLPRVRVGVTRAAGGRIGVVIGN